METTLTKGMGREEKGSEAERSKEGTCGAASWQADLSVSPRWQETAGRDRG
jgi:hypothetical protein